jgi:rhodanese-related sulfurtransferase
MAKVKEIKRNEVEQKIANGEDLTVIDVREADELAEKKMPGVKHIPIGEIPNRLSEFKKEEPYYIICERGNRSGEVTEYLEERGYDATNITDGMVGWEDE